MINKKSHRIVEKMTNHEVVAVMADGKPSVIVFLSDFIEKDLDGLKYVKYLDDLEIYGWEIHNLYNHTCYRNLGRFKTTIDMLRSGRIPKETIHKNLSQSATATFTIWPFCPPPEAGLFFYSFLIIFIYFYLYLYIKEVLTIKFMINTSLYNIYLLA